MQNKPAETMKKGEKSMSLEQELKDMSVQEIVQSIRSDIDRMETMYREADGKNPGWNSDKALASQLIQPISEKMRISLINHAGITAAGVKNFQEYTINKLYADKWITDREWEKLDALRLIRNSFEHQYETDLGIPEDADDRTRADYERKKKRLKHYRDIFSPEILRWCRDDVAWYENRAEQIREGVRVENSCTWQPEIDPQTGYSRIPQDNLSSSTQSFSTDSNDPGFSFDPPEAYAFPVRVHSDMRDIPLSDRVHAALGHLGLPVVISVVLAVIFGMLSDLSFVTELAETHGLALSQYNVSHSLTVIFFLLAVLYVLFYHLTAQVLCGTVIFVLAKSATDSAFCAILTAILMVLLVTRFTEKLKKMISAVFYGFWLLVFVCGMPSILSSRLGEDEPLDAYTVCIKIALPMLLYVLIFVLTPFVLKSFHRERPFGNVLSDKEIHTAPLVLSAVPVIGLIFVITLLYRTTWTRSLILLTRDFYASPSAFWTVHTVMIALVLYFFSIMKRYRTLTES